MATKMIVVRQGSEIRTWVEGQEQVVSYPYTTDEEFVSMLRVLAWTCKQLDCTLERDFSLTLDVREARERIKAKKA